MLRGANNEINDNWYTDTSFNLSAQRPSAQMDRERSA